MAKGDQEPIKQEDLTWRPKNQLQLFDGFMVKDTTEHKSDGIECGAFRKFGLYLTMKSTSTPTTLQIKVEFLDRWSGQWCTHKQGPFAALFYEDTDLATLTSESFSGDVLGRAMRVTLTGVGTTGTEYFTVSVSVDFWS